MAQKAFEAYGKSSPVPASLLLPSPLEYVPHPVSMDTGGIRQGLVMSPPRQGDYHRGAVCTGYTDSLASLAPLPPLPRRVLANCCL